MQSEGKTSKNPIKEVLGEKRNLKIVLIAIFGAVAGQAVIWYTGHFYSLYFMTNTLRLDASTAYVYLTIALVLGTPFFVVFGWLSDIIGRKWIIIAGCALSAFLFIPVFNGLMTYGNRAFRRSGRATRSRSREPSASPSNRSSRSCSPRPRPRPARRPSRS